jgi:putative integral membrane protein (TIGR02587 family)
MARSSRRDPDPHGWRREGKDLVRGIAAGSIIGMPLLFTMEMWWHGMVVSEGHLFVLLTVMLGANFGFCLFSGFRDSYSVREAASEAVTSTALGLVFAFVVLCLIREITFDLAPAEALGKMIIEAVPVSLGISFANVQIRDQAARGGEEDGGAGDGGAREEDPDALENRQLRQDLQDLAVTVTGAVVFAFNVAPTEEVLQIAARLPAWQHVVVMLVSGSLCYLILYASDFKQHQVHVGSVFQSPLAETVTVYAVALVVSALLLLLVGVPETTSSVAIAVKSVVTLGLLASVGASAGRLVV